jgi:hypothetical protein
MIFQLAAMNLTSTDDAAASSRLAWSAADVNPHFFVCAM